MPSPAAGGVRAGQRTGGRPGRRVPRRGASRRRRGRAGRRRASPPAAQDSPADEAPPPRQRRTPRRSGPAAEPSRGRGRRLSLRAGPESAAGVAPSTVATPVIPAAEAAAEAVPADAAAVDSQTRGAPTVFADPPEAEAASAGGETVVADDGPPGTSRRKLAIPAARVTPAPPAAQRPQPRPAPARRQRPARPSRPSPPPSRRSARPRATPRPAAARLVPSRPPPHAERRPAYGGSSGAGQGAPRRRHHAVPPPRRPRAVRGPVAALPRPRQAVRAGHRRRPDRARPRQRAADCLARGRRHHRRRRRRGRGAGAEPPQRGGSPTRDAVQPAARSSRTPRSGFKSVDALNNPSTALPSGWRHATVTAADLGAPAVAGFSIDLPPGWTEQRSGAGHHLQRARRHAAHRRPDPAEHHQHARRGHQRRARRPWPRASSPATSGSTCRRFRSGTPGAPSGSSTWTQPGASTACRRRHLFRQGDDRRHAGLRHLHQVAAEHVQRHRAAAVRPDPADLPDGPS